MGSVGDQGRTYPLKRPKGHQVPVPRWSLKFPSNVTHVYTLYVGVQAHNGNRTLAQKAEEIISTLLSKRAATGPFVDNFRTTDGNDLVDSRVWVAYWTDAREFEDTLSQLDLHSIWKDLGDGNEGIGIWSEHFTTPIDRLETNYSRLDHKPGLAQIPDTERPGHDTTAYWGAGRDRIPASAHDLFEPPTDQTITPPTPTPRGVGQRLRGANYENMCHIRSGQWWVECDDAERAAYEDDLQGTLMEGMRYLWEHAAETGTIGLRFVQNVDARSGAPIRETCAAGFHRNWADLEKWSSRHKSHLAIFNGAIRHAKRFGEGRKLMTWHEVSILKTGEAAFDYVNCDPRTGVIKWVKLDVQNL